MQDLTPLLHVQGRLAPEGYPLVSGFADAVHLPRFPDVVLKLRKRADNVEHQTALPQAAFRCGGVDGLVKDFEFRPFLPEAFGDSQQVLHGAGEPVQLRDHQHVAFPQNP